MRLSPTLFRIAAVLLALLITVGSLQPAGGGGSLPHVDKLMHLLAYGGLAGLAGLGWRDIPLWAVVLLAALFGIGIEIAQATLTDGRTASVADGLANLLGALLAALALGRLRPD